MSESDGIVLRGLPGDNPLGFLAALGVQAALAEHGDRNRLHWTDDPIPYPVVSPAATLQQVADAALAMAGRLLGGPALDESLDAKLKLKPPAIMEYLSRGRLAGAAGSLTGCLLAEDSLDNGGYAKPTDLYFLAGQQKFVSAARTILGEVTMDEIVADMSTPWRYESKRDSLMWDSVDDRRHAYSAFDPTSSQSPKLTNPGVEALAVIGLTRYPCYATPQGTLTQGCSGSWKRGVFVWPLWIVPASVHSVRSLLAQVDAPSHASDRRSRDRRAQWYAAWGISRVMQSQIRRTDQGGYGTFGPPRVVWQRV
ncbi:MAG: hypothetical protein OXD34_14670 [bacterium]|nr:hypothetical protein [bacterium]